MNTFYITLGAVIIAVFLLVRLGIVRFKLSLQDGFAFELGLRPSTKISIGNSLGVVVSTDGESRKLHLYLVVSTNTDAVIENIKLTLDDKIYFRIKQFYSEDPERLVRLPNRSIRLPLTLQNQAIRLQAEFETYEYSSFTLTEGHHAILLELKTDKKVIRRKNTIDIQANSLRALEIAKASAQRQRKGIAESNRFGQVSVIEVPIILE